MCQVRSARATTNLEGLLGEVTFEEELKAKEKPDIWRAEGTTIQAMGIAYAKALRWKRTLGTQETERRPVRVGGVSRARPWRTFPALVRSIHFILGTTGSY